MLRILIISEYEIVGEIIASPIFLIVLVLPFVVIYSLIRKKDFTNVNVAINIFRHILFYLFVHFAYILLFEKEISVNFNGFGFEFIKAMVGVLLYFIFHVLFMTYILKRPWIQKFLLTKK